jgi:SAM-dependent methyltransferase
MSSSKVDPTLAYYDEFGCDFAAATVAVDMADLRRRFLAQIPPGGSILDAGCGSGRDSKAFSDLGYRVQAMDGSRTMVELATALTGRPARLLRFEDLDYRDEFDGIWACASLLHLTRANLDPVLRRLLVASKPQGVIYMSFKHGLGERTSKGRHFTDFTCQTLRDWLSTNRQLHILDIRETGDQRAERADERWVNALVQKVSC